MAIDVSSGSFWSALDDLAWDVRTFAVVLDGPARRSERSAMPAGTCSFGALSCIFIAACFCVLISVALSFYCFCGYSRCISINTRFAPFSLLL